MKMTLKLILSALLLVLAGCSQVNQPVFTARSTIESALPAPINTEAGGEADSDTLSTLAGATSTLPITSAPALEVIQPGTQQDAEPTIGILPRLTKRAPTIAEIQAYLKSVPTRLLDGENHSSMVEGYFADNPLSEVAKITYHDLNGDGNQDLIVSDLDSFFWGQGSMTILLWDGTGFSDPAMLSDFAKYSPRHRVTFDDWIGDGLPEVVYDFASDTGGTGVVEMTHTRNIVHCDLACELVWSHILGHKTADYSVGRENVEIKRSTGQTGRPALTVSTEAFHAPSLILNPTFPSKYLNVLTSTLSSYVWNGTVFQREGEEVTSLPIQIESQSQLLAESSAGVKAQVLSVAKDATPSRPSFDCQLHVDGVVFGNPFDCDPNFTRTEWLDITGDGQDEIIVIAVAFATQRLFAYEWTDDNNPRLIADVTGDIIRPDLFGVRLTDLDGDGIPEIVAGVDGFGEPTYCQQESRYYESQMVDICWYDWILGDITYKWDGNEFVE